MAGVAVVTDSTSSLTSTTADRTGITLVSLQVVIDGHSRPEIEVDPRLVAAALREGKRVTTSRPSPQAFSMVYDSLAGAGHGPERCRRYRGTPSRQPRGCGAAGK